MPTKTAVKKTSKKAAKTPVKRAPKKVTWDDIQEGFKQIEKVQKEAWVAIRETQEVHKETEKATQKAIDETWAVIREVQKGNKELQKGNKELQKGNKEMQKGFEELRQGSKEMQKAVKETQKNIGGLNNTLGSIVEHILTPALPQKFKKLGYSFNRIATYKFAEGVYAQIDGMLENGELAIAVEVKATLRYADIDEHLVRMEKIRKHADEYGDKRQFMGAMASTIADKTTRDYALKKGLFVIEPSGEDVKVIKPEGEPKVW